MPFEIVDSSNMPESKRKSKITRLKEYQELRDAKLPAGKVARIKLLKETTDQFKSPQQAVISFVQRARLDFSDRFDIKIIGEEIWVSPAEDKQKNK
jgi:hypothetical protein